MLKKIVQYLLLCSFAVFLAACGGGGGGDGNSGSSVWYTTACSNGLPSKPVAAATSNGFLTTAGVAAVAFAGCNPASIVVVSPAVGSMVDPVALVTGGPGIVVSSTGSLKDCSASTLTAGMATGAVMPGVTTVNINKWGFAFTTTALPGNGQTLVFTPKCVDTAGHTVTGESVTFMTSAVSCTAALVPSKTGRDCVPSTVTCEVPQVVDADTTGCVTPPLKTVKCDVPNSPNNTGTGCDVWWRPAVLIFDANKHYGVGELPAGCGSWYDETYGAVSQCWKDAAKDGKMKFFDSSAKAAGYSQNRPVFAIFHGPTGQWDILPFWLETGWPAGSTDLTRGRFDEIDWVGRDGVDGNVIIHTVNGCERIEWDSSAKVIVDTKLKSCPV